MPEGIQSFVLCHHFNGSYATVTVVCAQIPNHIPHHRPNRQSYRPQAATDWLPQKWQEIIANWSDEMCGDGKWGSGKERMKKLRIATCKERTCKQHPRHHTQAKYELKDACDTHTQGGA